MKPTALDYGVKAVCSDCGAMSFFDWRKGGTEFGTVIHNIHHDYAGYTFTRIIYKLLSCSGCGRGGLAKFHDKGQLPGRLESFYPRALASAPLPEKVPDGIINEYREAELCASVEAWRAASALLRSTLEKTLKENGYKKGSLEAKIDEAASDSVITTARSQKVHENIRVLGNDVVHEEWREIDEEEVSAALHYAQRILEDFYDDRVSVEKILIKKDRLPPTPKSGG